MGGDGGTIGSNRLYMRGAGTATHTADAARHGAQHSEDAREWSRQAMRTCALTGAPLSLRGRGAVVSCPYGRLYDREAAVEALLQRSRRDDDDEDGDGGGGGGGLGGHVRGLRDLFPVRFHFPAAGDDEGGGERTMPTCPVTGTELNGTQPAFLLVGAKPKKKKKKTKGEVMQKEQEEESRPNVVSERAIKEMGIDELQSDFGPFAREDMVRLAVPPYGDAMEEIKAALTRRREEERLAKAARGNRNGGGDDGGKKRKKLGADVPVSADRRGGDSGEKQQKRLMPPPGCGPPSAVAVGGCAPPPTAVEMARTSAASAVAGSEALSSLFVTNDRSVSEKEKRDNLFAR